MNAHASGAFRDCSPRVRVVTVRLQRSDWDLPQFTARGPVQDWLFDINEVRTTYGGLQWTWVADCRAAFRCCFGIGYQNGMKT